MTARVIDGFDYLLDGTDSAIRQQISAAGYFPSTTAITGDDAFPDDITVGRFGFGKCVRYDGSSRVLSQGKLFVGMVKPLGVNASEGIISVSAIREAASDSHDSGIAIAFYDAIEMVPQVVIMLAPMGVIKVYRGDGNNLLISSDPGVFKEDVYFSLEAKAVIDNTGGSVEVRVNTKTVINLVSSDTQASPNAFFNAAGWGMSTWSQTGARVNNIAGRFDDFYCLDDQGTVNNNWLGNNRVKTQFMIADGSHIDFSIGGTNPAATHWQSVNNFALDDTKYIYSPDVGDYDLYDPDPNLNSPLVNALQVRIVARQDDSTQRSIKGLINVGGTLAEGTETHYLDQTYAHYPTIFELNPDTGVSFTGTEVNGSEPGVKIES